MKYGVPEVSWFISFCLLFCRDRMASPRLPVPSAGLLRFLRRQTECLSYFSPNHDTSIDIEKPSQKALCTARLQPAVLRAGVVDFSSLVPAREPRICKVKQSPYTHISSRYQHSTPDRPQKPCRPAWQQWFLGFGTRNRPARPLEPDDLPEADREGNNNSMFNTHRQLSAKAASEPRLRCTEVDDNGNVILVDSEFKKSELIARVYHESRPKHVSAAQLT